jgi:hypothetical protein
MKPAFMLVMISAVFITGSIFSPLLFLLSSSYIAYGQTPDQALSSPSPSEQQPSGSAPIPSSSTSPLGQAPEQALSSPSISSNQTTAQQEEQQPQPPPSGIPGLLFLPPEQQQPSPSAKPEQPPALAPLTQITANETIDSLIFAPGTRWIATGNWSMVLRNGNVNSFNADMTWYNNNGTATHTHELLNLRASPVDITQQSGHNILIRALTDVGTNHRITWTSVPATIDIKGGKTISILLDDIITNKHFAGQAIYGVVKSFAKCSDQPGQNMEVLEPCSTSSPLLSSSLPSP